MKNNRTKTDIFFERIPPLITWIFITFPIWSGYFFPEFTAYVILFLNVYFVYKSISIAILLFMALIRLRNNESINWLHKLSDLENTSNAIDALYQKRKEIEMLDPSSLVTNVKITKREFGNKFLNSLNTLPFFLKNLLGKLEKRKAIKYIDKQIELLKKIDTEQIIDWKELHHVVIIPHWKEPEHILETTLENIKKSNYPTNKINIVLGAEARDNEGIEISNRLAQKYSEYFENVWVNSHELKENEIIGKSSNMFSASKYLYDRVTKLGWDIKKVTVTSCDADSILPADYFANLSYIYATTKDREYKYFTGAVLLYANIWRLPFFARVKNSMSTLYNLLKMIRTDKLIPFSTYTLSLWMIKEINFWSPDVTPEDFHTFFKGLLKYPDQVETLPIFQRILSDSAEGNNMYDTMLNNYKQERRWAWGVSDDGWIMHNLILQLQAGKLKAKTAYYGLHTIWDHVTIGIIVLITYGGNIVALVNPRFGYTVLGSNLSSISSFLIRISLIFFVFTILMDRFVKPSRGKKSNIFLVIFHFFEWFLQPIIGVILIVIPGIEAHTRLLFGKYLEYYLTKKK